MVHLYTMDTMAYIKYLAFIGSALLTGCGVAVSVHRQEFIKTVIIICYNWSYLLNYSP